MKEIRFQNYWCLTGASDGSQPEDIESLGRLRGTSTDSKAQDQGIFKDDTDWTRTGREKEDEDSLLSTHGFSTAQVARLAQNNQHTEERGSSLSCEITAGMYALQIGVLRF